MRNFMIGLTLALTLVLATPAVAADGTPFEWPSFDLVEWVFDLLEALETELAFSETGSGNDLNGESPSTESGGPEDPPTTEMGPAAEPWG